MHQTTEPQNIKKQNLRKLAWTIYKSKIIVGKFNTPVSATDRTTRHKTNNYVEEKTQPIRSHWNQ